jgi:acyl carrier protein
MADSQQPTLGRIVEYVRNVAILDPSQEIPLDRSLIEAGIFDSFAVVEMLTFLETTFQLTIPEKDVTREKFGSIQKMANYVDRHQQQPS